MIIPLVQTFGHLEFVLKLEEYKELREVPIYPQAVCPSQDKTWTLIKEIIDQVRFLTLLVATLSCSHIRIWQAICRVPVNCQLACHAACERNFYENVSFVILHSQVGFSEPSPKPFPYLPSTLTYIAQL